MAKQRLVIVGCGMAATRLVEELVERGGTDLFQIAVYGEEPCPSYERLQLADVMNGSCSIEQILHRAPAWYAERAVRVHWGERVVLVSRQARVAYGSAGTEERYDTLVFATGSSPHFPPIKNLFNAQGKRLPGVCDFRTLADCVQIVALCSGARAVAIIGGGRLGLEAARGLAGGGRQVELIHLIHRGTRLLSANLDEQRAREVLQSVEAMGVRVRLCRGVEALSGSERVTGVLLDDGSELTSDLVVIASGLIPNTWLAFQCGLTVELGIAVDGQLRSVDDRRVYALGECAQPRGRLHSDPELVRQQARLLAEQLTRGDAGASQALAPGRPSAGWVEPGG